MNIIVKCKECQSVLRAVYPTTHFDDVILAVEPCDCQDKQEAYDRGYDDGFEDGREEGRDQGYEEARAEQE